jgi:hypothetical protein
MGKSLHKGSQIYAISLIFMRFIGGDANLAQVVGGAGTSGEGREDDNDTVVLGSAGVRIRECGISKETRSSAGNEAS